MNRIRYGGRAPLIPAAGVVALALTLSACTGSQANQSGGGPTSAKPHNGGSVTVGLDGDADNLLPGAAQQALAGNIEQSVIFDPLMAVDTSGKFQPFLAQSLTPNKDLTEWTLKLRPGVKFSDGTPLNAQALKADFDDYLTTSAAVTLSYLQEGGKTDKIQVVNPLTVKYILAQPDASFPYVLTTDAGMPFSATAAKAAGKNAGLKPVGTGPFMIKSWSPGQQMVLKRNPYYWRKGTVHLTQLTFKPIPDDTSRLNDFKSGGINVMSASLGSTLAQLHSMQTSGSATLDTFTGDNAGGNVLNTAKPPFDDVRVRRALLMATNFNVLNQLTDGVGFTTQATQYFAKNSPWFSTQAQADYPKYNVAAATKLLNEYRNDPNRSDGKPVGSPVSFTYQCQPTAFLTQLGQAEQSEWNKVGFNMSIDGIEQATMVSNVVGSPDTKPPYVGNFNAACWRFDAEPDPIKLATDFGPANSPLNFTNYTNPGLTKAIAELRSTTDVAKRKDAAHQISVILAKQVPEQFLSSTVQGIAFGPGVHASKNITLPGGGVGRPQIGGAAIDWSSLWVDK